MDTYQFPFAELDNLQLVFECQHIATTLPFDHYNSVVFNPIECSDHGDPLENNDPDNNLLVNYNIFNTTNYYVNTDFVNLLNNDEGKQTMLFDNIRSIPNNLESFICQHLDQWFLTWVRSNPRGSVSQFEGFGGLVHPS